MFIYAASVAGYSSVTATLDLVVGMGSCKHTNREGTSSAPPSKLLVAIGSRYPSMAAEQYKRQLIRHNAFSWLIISMASATGQRRDYLALLTAMYLL